MSVQRFNAFPGVSRTEKTTEGKPLPIAFMAQLPDGEWVKFSDHQSSLAERELRLKVLEEALATISKGYISGEDAMRLARAALATEGETK